MTASTIAPAITRTSHIGHMWNMKCPQRYLISKSIRYHTIRSSGARELFVLGKKFFCALSWLTGAHDSLPNLAAFSGVVATVAGSSCN